MNLKWIQRCRICGNPHLDTILDFGEMPNQGAFEFKDRPAPFRRLLPNKIVRCNTKKLENSCGLVQNAVVVDPRVLYANYGYQSSISASMREHLKSVAGKIAKEKRLYECNVCDIGANDGYLLSCYPSDVGKIAIDPSDVVRTIQDKSVDIFNECFPSASLSSKYSGKIEVLTAIACLYDINDFYSFFHHLNYIMTPTGIGVFEVAYLPTVLQRLAYDGMVIEHASTFSLCALEHLFKMYGWVIYKAEKTETNGGSLLFFACRNENLTFNTPENDSALNTLRFEEFEMALDDPITYKDFEVKVMEHITTLTDLLYSLKGEGKKIHIYGASTKLNLILGYGEIGPELIDCAAERDPKKWGGKLLNGIPIVPEEESRKTVDVYFCGPYHFKPEILEREKEIRDRGVKFLFPLPQIELI